MNKEYIKLYINGFWKDNKGKWTAYISDKEPAPDGSEPRYSFKLEVPEEYLVKDMGTVSERDLKE